MPEVLPLERRPWLIAHRAANSLGALAAAREAGADLAECDIWSYRGRYEVRHEKTLGPLPLRWDRWMLETTRVRHIDLDGLLAASTGSPGLLIDLKGRDRRLPAGLLAALERHAASVVVCARRPELLESIGARGVPVFPSVDNEAGVRRLERLGSRDRWTGVSVHRKLLSPAMVTRLRTLAPLIISWPVNTSAEAATLAGMGIDGLISDNLALIAELAATRALR